MKRNLVIIGVALFFVLCFSKGHLSGWKICSVYDCPRTLTHEALVLSTGRRVGWDGSALFCLRDGSREPDGHAPDYITSRWSDLWHYVGGSTYGDGWDEAREERANHRMDAMIYALSSDPESHSSCLRAIGNIFHQAQDFYAHTNYVRRVDPNNAVIADLDAESPPPGLSGWGLGDDPSVPRGDIMTELAKLATLKEWELFEDLFYSSGYDATVYINNLGMSSRIMVLNPGPGHSPAPLVVPQGPYQGFGQGGPAKIKWFHTAIQHSLPITIELLKNWSSEGYIFRSTFENQLLLDADEYLWDFFHVTDENGLLKEVESNNNEACYVIKISTPGDLYYTYSVPFYILDPIKGAPSTLIAECYGWNMIKVSWGDGSNCEAGFDILRRIVGEENFVLVKSLGPNVKSTVDESAVADIDYEYLVRARFSDGSYAYSNAAFGRAFGDPPGAPANLEAVSFNNRIWLAWTDGSNNEQGFIIERKGGYESDFSERTRVAANRQTFEDKLVYPGTKYYYRIKAYNPAGTSCSEIIEIVFE